MKKQPTDKVAWDAAHAITEVTQKGEDITRNATLKATAGMAKMLANIDSTGAKIEMLKHHALYIGVATQLRNNTLKLAREMVHDITELTGDEQHAKMMTDIWLAKVVRDIVKDINDEQK